VGTLDASVERRALKNRSERLTGVVRTTDRDVKFVSR
jgi:hypothetical protein